MNEKAAVPLLRSLVEIAPSLHTAGTFPAAALRALARHAGSRNIRHSVETGSGVSTLLLSHMSDDHTVFAMDAGSGSIANVQSSPLLRKSAVTFIEGPTQLTLPQHRFANKLQFALLDGPHAYPFPDLEYYYLYPHLDENALLVLDDINIPTTRNLFQFLREDDMFELEEVVLTTAFFRRTAAPAFDPYADGWWNQAYNRRRLWASRFRPQFRQIIPTSWKRVARKIQRNIFGLGASLTITAPDHHARVGGTGRVSGLAAGSGNSWLWVLAHRKDQDAWWPQAHITANASGTWETQVRYGNPEDAGHLFEIAALLVSETTHALWEAWLQRSQESSDHPPVHLPPAEFIRAAAYRTVVRSTDS